MIGYFRGKIQKYCTIFKHLTHPHVAFVDGFIQCNKKQAHLTYETKHHMKIPRREKFQRIMF